MGALAHLIEQRGIATTTIGLIRLHLEKIRVPRALAVPFELGRPLGEPENPAFQRRVLLAALGLLERTDGPVVLDDFPEEAPGRLPLEGWKPAVVLPAVPVPGPDASAADWANALCTEWTPLLWTHMRHAGERGRSTVGGGQQDRERWPELFAAFAAGTPPVESAVPGLRAVQAMRYVADDLKALYTEAAIAPGSGPSSRQVLDWFWNDTVAGALLQVVRARCLASDDKVLNIVGTMQIVPGARVR